MTSRALRRVADGLVARFPAVAGLLTEAEPDLLVHFTFPDAHRPRIRRRNLRAALLPTETIARIDAVTATEEVGLALLMAS